MTSHVGLRCLERLRKPCDQLCALERTGEHLEAAKELETKVLETRKTMLEPEHPDTLYAMGNMTLTYLKQG